MKLKGFLTVACCLLALTVVSAHGNKSGRASLSVGEATISIDFVGPALQGRDIQTLLQQPNANPWRLGADRPTTLSTPLDLKFGDAVLPAGDYVLRAYRDRDEGWWLQALDSSGTVVGRMPLQNLSAGNSEENMVISLTGSGKEANLKVHWGRQVLQGTFSVAH